MKDVYQKFIKPRATEKHYFRASKMITVLWGIFAIGAALLMTETTQAARQTTIVLINAVGSMLYGPILAAFLLGMFTQNIGARAVKWGVLAGIFFNLLLWIFTSVSWMWWNVSGFLSAVIVAAIVNGSTQSLNQKESPKQAKSIIAGWNGEAPKWRIVYGIIVLYFFLILAVSWWLER